jgi:hypothetical protein
MIADIVRIDAPFMNVFIFQVVEDMHAPLSYVMHIVYHHPKLESIS